MCPCKCLSEKQEEQSRTIAVIGKEIAVVLMIWRGGVFGQFCELHGDPVFICHQSWSWSGPAFLSGSITITQ